MLEGGGGKSPKGKVARKGATRSASLAAQCLICKEFGGALLQCDVRDRWVHTLCAGMLPETSIVSGFENTNTQCVLGDCGWRGER